jgi:ribulose-phosphate 3-epimerase
MIDEVTAKTGKQIMLQVDGGVTTDNIAKVLEAGADTIVAGSAVFSGGAANYAKNIAALRA